MGSSDELAPVCGTMIRHRHCWGISMIVCAHAVMPGTLGYGLSIIGSAVEETCTRRKHEILGILGILGCQSASILCISRYKQLSGAWNIPRFPGFGTCRLTRLRQSRQRHPGTIRSRWCNGGASRREVSFGGYAPTTVGVVALLHLYSVSGLVQTKAETFYPLPLQRRLLLACIQRVLARISLPR